MKKIRKDGNFVILFYVRQSRSPENEVFLLFININSVDKMNVIILGSGGRENALAWKISQSPLLKQLYIAPGNAGTSQYGENIAINPLNFQEVKNICLDKKIDLIIPGGEDTLVAGIYDFIKNDSELKHIIVAGPSREGAQLEGSKAFSKEFMKKYNIPTAEYKEFNNSNYDEGVEYIKNHSLPVVLKADGLAAGKGVLICETTEDALKGFEQMIKEKAFGEAGTTVVIESFLDGIEVSFFVLTDGQSYHLLPHAKDYKRISEGDKGLNTGGMGAVSPVPFVTEEFESKVISRIIQPTINGLKYDQIDYKGFIFFGLINVAGEPWVIEYNCRLGDPETEVILPRIESDILEVLLSIDNDVAFKNKTIDITKKAAATVMLVSEGYPGHYEKGHIIEGHTNVDDNSIVFHAGTKSELDKVITNGGRVMAITSLDDTIANALEHSYKNINKICYKGITYRSDIGYEFK